MPYDQDYFLRTTKEVTEGVFSKPLDQVTHEEFSKSFSPDVAWYDHAFLIHRKGHLGIQLLRERWLTANQPYTVIPSEYHPVKDGVIMEGSCHGVFKNDLYTEKATGKEFTYQISIRFVFDVETGLINRVEEYYTRNWHESVPKSKYHVNSLPAVTS